MSSITRNRATLVRWALTASLALNAAGILLLGYVLKGRGGVAYLRAVTTHTPLNVDTVNYRARIGLFDMSAVDPASRPIVFLGDSLIFDGVWPEFFGASTPILNRGIGGDTSVGVLRRVHQVTALRPSAVFMMIGTNDHQLIGLSPEGTAHVIRDIVARIRQESPETLVYLQPILPSRVPGFAKWSEDADRSIALLADGRSVFYLNFRDQFLEGGLLAQSLTTDGLHLSAAGYQVWKHAIDPVISSLMAKRSDDLLRTHRDSGKGGFAPAGHLAHH